MSSAVSALFQKKVLLLGDSILRRMQRTQFFKNKFIHLSVVDLAVSGSTVKKGLETFSNFCDKTAVLESTNLVILLGTNDFLKNGQFDYSDYYDLARNAVASRFKNIILVKLPPIPKRRFLTEAICQANDWIASIARRKGLKGIEAPQHVSKDGVHLDSWGMRLLTTSIWQLVSE
ncbi:unnamed protein product [Bemisia tabaci]|uniref:SGNH hydrolase-type esterase domain-containing protein n=1 Tax=Bemisia tabaci TaxID=7038 RepID=A0A9P0F4R7_BEMTA|nr:unnamed protein product [Bemisia tabaci]